MTHDNIKTHKKPGIHPGVKLTPPSAVLGLRDINWHLLITGHGSRPKPLGKPNPILGYT